MVQTIPAGKLKLPELMQRFKLERSDDAHFFQEWQTDLPELGQEEQQELDEIKATYRHLSIYPLLEAVVKVVVLSPLLKLAGFYRAPFYLAAEQGISITSEDDGVIVQGRIDLLVFQPPFWVTVVEAKQLDYSIEAGIPQLLAYMLDSPNENQPTFGFITNGITFRFVKMVTQPVPRYELSDLFAIDRQDDLYQVLRILKRLAQLVPQQDSGNSNGLRNGVSN
ncbi:MAG: restriction endonuclease subunit R [Cyanothece sp. SIO2G6]|nr:restriction endonuclease subunit R [Cyanothece sp. SIO2G6]